MWELAVSTVLPTASVPTDTTSLTASTGKRQVKLPKVYLRDSGTLHALLVAAGFQPIITRGS